MSASHNRNPEGKNQFGPVVKASDKRLQEALQEYHRRRITNCNRISELLLAEHGIEMKPRTVRKRRTELQLLGSRAVMKQISPSEAEQLVIDLVNKDLAGREGVRNITRKIAAESGIHLTRQFVSDVMHRHFPDGFAYRDCSLKRNQRRKDEERETLVHKGQVSTLGALTTSSLTEGPAHSPVPGSTIGPPR